jgi:hypothetical protein
MVALLVLIPLVIVGLIRMSELAKANCLAVGACTTPIVGPNLLSFLKSMSESLALLGLLTIHWEVRAPALY